MDSKMVLSRPSPESLTVDGVLVSIWYLGDGEVVMMPMFGGYYAPKDEVDKYNKASKKVRRRLKSMGYDIDV